MFVERQQDAPRTHDLNILSFFHALPGTSRSRGYCSIWLRPLALQFVRLSCFQSGSEVRVQSVQPDRAAKVQSGKYSQNQPAAVLADFFWQKAEHKQDWSVVCYLLSKIFERSLWQANNDCQCVSLAFAKAYKNPEAALIFNGKRFSQFSLIFLIFSEAMRKKLSPVLVLIDPRNVHVNIYICTSCEGSSIRKLYCSECWAWKERLTFGRVCWEVFLILQ